MFLVLLSCFQLCCCVFGFAFWYAVLFLQATVIQGSTQDNMARKAWNGRQYGKLCIRRQFEVVYIAKSIIRDKEDIKKI